MSDKTLKPSTLRIGTRYRANRVDDHYDAIVVGSGIGGLATAALLSSLGKKVLVLEQHYTAGGFTHSYDRNGYEWDVGVHYIGDMGIQTEGRTLFDFISNGQLQWAEMDPVYDRVILGEESYDFVAGKDNFKSELKQNFPDEAEAIDQYVELICKTNKYMGQISQQKVMPGWLKCIFSLTGTNKLPRLCVERYL